MSDPRAPRAARRRPPLLVPGAIGALAVLLAVPPAHGQDASGTATGAGAQNALPVPGKGYNRATATQAAAQAVGQQEAETPLVQTGITAELAKFAKFDTLQPQGATTNFPGSFDSVLGDDDGWRSWLYQHDLYFRLISLENVTDNVLGETGSRQPQQYNGQKTTFTIENYFQFAWKLAGSGPDITQINVQFQDEAVSWQTVGPSRTNFLRLDLYSSFLNHRIEVDGGIGENIINYVGIFAGGNPILAAGLASTVPIEVGLNGGTASGPLLNVQVNGNDGYYSKTGIQRSVSPNGYVYEAQHNDHALAFSMPGANPLYIEELGLLRPASTDGRQIWLRAGGLYNTTNYARFDGNGTSKNWMLYALADYQVWKPSKVAPYSGVFLGASALIAPRDVNVYARTFELRAYQIGMVPGRPGDSGTFTIDYNGFSSVGRDQFVSEGLTGAQRFQWSASVLYALHVTRGIYLAPNITYLRNPSPIENYGSALNLGLTFTALL